MGRAIAVRTLYEALRDKLSLRWIGGEPILSTEVSCEGSGGAVAADSVGYLNLIRPSQIQVLGQAEIEFFASLGRNSLQDTLAQLEKTRPRCLIVGDNAQTPEELLAIAVRDKIPVLQSSLSPRELVEYLQYFLVVRGAETQTLHGVFLEIMGIGVLLAGASGVGKSELALELVTRGHRLIADDAPLFARVSPDSVAGSCPGVLQDFLEVRGLGILDIRAMFGDNAIKRGERLQLIVQLNRTVDIDAARLDRLQGDSRMRKVLDVDIPEIHLPVTAGGNLAVVVEAAVRNHLLRMNGYDGAAAFVERQKRLIERGGDT